MNSQAADSEEELTLSTKKETLLHIKMQILSEQRQYNSSITLWRNELHPTNKRRYEIFQRQGDFQVAISIKVDSFLSYNSLIGCLRAVEDYDAGLDACAEAEKLLGELKQAGLDSRAIQSANQSNANHHDFFWEKVQFKRRVENLEAAKKAVYGLVVVGAATLLTYGLIKSRSNKKS